MEFAVESHSKDERQEDDNLEIGLHNHEVEDLVKEAKKLTMIGEILNRDVSVSQVRSVINLHKNWKSVKPCMLWTNSKKLSS